MKNLEKFSRSVFQGIAHWMDEDNLQEDPDYQVPDVQQDLDLDVDDPEPDGFIPRQE